MSKPRWSTHKWAQIFQGPDGRWFGVIQGWNLAEHIKKGDFDVKVIVKPEHGKCLSRGAIEGNWRESTERRPKEYY